MSPVSTPYETTLMAARRSIEARYNELVKKASKTGHWQYFGTYFDYVAAGYFESFQRSLVWISDGKVYVLSVNLPHQQLSNLFGYEICHSLEENLGDDYFCDHFSASKNPVDYWRVWNCGEHVSKMPDFCLTQEFSIPNDASGQNARPSRVLIAGEVGAGYERSVPELIREAAQYLSRYTNVTYAVGVFFRSKPHSNDFEFEYFVLQRTEDNQFNATEDYNENHCLGNFAPREFRNEPGRENFFEERGVRFLVPPTIITSAEIEHGNREIRFWLPGTGLGPFGEDIQPIQIVIRNSALRSFHRAYTDWWNGRHDGAKIATQAQ